MNELLAGLLMREWASQALPRAKERLMLTAEDRRYLQELLHWRIKTYEAEQSRDMSLGDIQYKLGRMAYLGELKAKLNTEDAK